jgi:hypothetical protein
MPSPHEGRGDVHAGEAEDDLRRHRRREQDDECEQREMKMEAHLDAAPAP